MDAKDRIQKLESTLFQKSQEAAQQADTTRVIEYANMLEESSRLKRKLEEIIVTLERLEANLVGSRPLISRTANSKAIEPRRASRLMSSKQVAREERERLTQDLRSNGIFVFAHPEHGQLFSTANTLIGVPFSNETGKFPDRWFFGLPKMDYTHIVFLCGFLTGEIVRYVLPRELTVSNLKKFSTDHVGQLKFSVFKKGSRMELGIPNSERIDITNYKENFNAVR